jgi:hypothetical protein
MKKEPYQVTQPKCIGDLKKADQFQIMGNCASYQVRDIGEWGEIGMYHNNTLVGYVHNTPPEKKGFFEVRRTMYGLIFSSFIEYKKITGWIKNN